MPAGARPHKITERCLAYSPGARKPWQCKHCDRIFRTKRSALHHECVGKGGRRSTAASRAPGSTFSSCQTYLSQNPHPDEEASRDER